MDDLIERLRRVDHASDPFKAAKAHREAADEIERLTATIKNQRHTCGVLAKDNDKYKSRVEKLEGALEWYAKSEPIELHRTDHIIEHQRIAKEALAATEQDHD